MRVVLDFGGLDAAGYGVEDLQGLEREGEGVGIWQALYAVQGGRRSGGAILWVQIVGMK
jgi:hypothetical protein